MDNFAWGNIAVNFTLFGTTAGTVAWFVKKWVHGVEKTMENTAADLAKETKSHTNALERADKYFRQEVKASSDKIECSLDKLAEQVRIGNGRTAKLETAIEVQAAICKQKTEGRRRDNCEA